MYRQSEKNLLRSNISSTCPHNMVNFGPLTAEIGSGVWGTPTNFNGFCVLQRYCTASSSGRQPNFALCLAVSWPGTLYIHFLDLLLWSPYVIGRPYIFSCCSFYLLSSFLLLFFPRLISAVGDWMSTILLHMAWP